MDVSATVTRRFERAQGDLAGFQKRLAEAPVLLSPDGFAHANRGA